MKIIVNHFKTAIREVCGKKEPVFDDTVNYTCRIVDNAYFVDCFNIPAEKLDLLKQKYQWLSEEEIEVADPEDIRMPMPEVKNV